jgi:Protein of unknown function (DUF2281)
MTQTEILQRLDQLPPDIQQQALAYLDALVQQHAPKTSPDRATQPKRTPGALAGKIWMSDDFDAPLEDFQDYT